ncbi:MAG: hypothetical protein Q8M31_18465 [Beijerinckiaceae bacterium]|nr:hypothetical protein [Beijerinckiaceae bacterium]
MKLFAYAFAAMALAALTLIAAPWPAFAQDGVVTVPWGDWIAGALVHLRDAVIAGVVALVAWAARRLPTQIGEIVLAARVEQLLTRAADYGIAAVGGAMKGKTLDVRTTNHVIEAAAEYAIANAPALVEKLGDTLRPKLLARLAPVVGIEVTAESVDAAVSP